MRSKKNLTPPSPEWFDLRRRFYAVLLREGADPETAEEIVRERHKMYMEDAQLYRAMLERYEKHPGWSDDAPMDESNSVSGGSPPA